MGSDKPVGAVFTAALILLGFSVEAGAASADVQEKTVGGQALAGVGATDRAVAARARADALVARMTLDEKIGLVHGLFPPMAKGKTRSELIPSAGHIDGVPRLGIPLVRESDASLGVANQIEQRRGDTATALPSSLATAATFSPEIARAGGTMIGAETRAKRFNVLLAGGVNLTRDPWGGRNFEYLGEDPLLAGRLAGAHIAGVQSNGIVSTVKHLSLNPQETGRAVIDARIDEAAHRESDLLAFQIAIEDGQPGSVMCAYNKVNGDWACENRHLLIDVLKRDWGFSGWVMSDWGAAHTTEKAANAGLDQESGQELDQTIVFADRLKAAVEAGRVPMARLDDMVARYLTGLMTSGAFDRPVPARPAPIPYAAHARIAQDAAEAGIVLLKNDAVAGRAVLPLAATARRIVVIGGRADIGVLSGGGSSQVRSVGGVPFEMPLPPEHPAASFVRVTYHQGAPLAAIRALAPRARVTFVDGRDPAVAAAAARDADVAIVFATQWTTEAADAADLSLPYGQDALIEAVAAAQPATAVVLETSGPVLMPWASRVPAIVEAWYPGQRGAAAIANVLYGRVNPSGRLPMTFPAAASQAPRPSPVGLERLNARDLSNASNPPVGAAKLVDSWPVEYREGSDVGYRWYERRGQAPLFPFGHGLSYTQFAFRNPVVTGGAGVSVSVDVTNTGRVAGADVPQLYVAREGADTPMRLAAFRRVTLKPGETRRVTLVAEPRILADYDTGLPGWRVRGGRYRVAIARDAADRTMVRTVEVDPRTMKP